MSNILPISFAAMSFMQGVATTHPTALDSAVQSASPTTPLVFEAETDRNYLPYTCVALYTLTKHLTADSHVIMVHDATIGDEEKALIQQALVQKDDARHTVEFRLIDTIIEALPRDFLPTWENIKKVINNEFIAVRALFPAIFADLPHLTHIDMDMVFQADLGPLLIACQELDQPLVSANLALYCQMSRICQYSMTEFFKKETIYGQSCYCVSGGLMVFNMDKWRAGFSSSVQSPTQTESKSLSEEVLRWLKENCNAAQGNLKGQNSFLFSEKSNTYNYCETEEELLGMMIYPWMSREVFYIHPFYNITPKWLEEKALISIKIAEISEGNGQMSIVSLLAGNGVYVWHWDHCQKPLRRCTRIDAHTYDVGVPEQAYFANLGEFIQRLAKDDRARLEMFTKLVHDQSEENSFAREWLANH